MLRCLFWYKNVSGIAGWACDLLRLLLSAVQLFSTRTEKPALDWRGLTTRDGHCDAPPLVYRMEKWAAWSSKRAGCRLRRLTSTHRPISWFPWTCQPSGPQTPEHFCPVIPYGCEIGWSSVVKTFGRLYRVKQMEGILCSLSLRYVV